MSLFWIFLPAALYLNIVFGFVLYCALYDRAIHLEPWFFKSDTFWQTYLVLSLWPVFLVRLGWRYFKMKKPGEPK